MAYTLGQQFEVRSYLTAHYANCSSSLSTMMLPMFNEEVAAGEGALLTLMTFSDA